MKTAAAMKTIASINTIILNCLHKTITAEQALKLIRQILAP